MKQTEKLSMLTVDMGDRKYELDGGSGGLTPGVPIPRDTVDSAAIIDEAVMMRDLNPEVKDTMLTDDDRVTPEDLAGFII